LRDLTSVHFGTDKQNNHVSDRERLITYVITSLNTTVLSVPIYPATCERTSWKHTKIFWILFRIFVNEASIRQPWLIKWCASIVESQNYLPIVTYNYFLSVKWAKLKS